MNFKKLFLFAVISGSLIIACSKKSSDSTDTDDSDAVSSIAKQALSEASGNASSSEGGSVGASMISDQIEVMSNELQQLNDPQNYISPEDRVTQMATACSYATNRTCSSGTGTIDWNSCTITVNGKTSTMTGGWTETWSTAADCSASRLTSGSTVTRTSSGSTMTGPRGGKIVTDTSGGTTYDNTTIASGGIITTRTNTTTRTIQMATNAAIHQVGTGRLGTKLFDYFVKPDITVTGSLKNSGTNGLTGNRSISGTTTIYHNLAKYTATNTFNTVVWGDSTCCYPTSGSISATYSGTNKPADSSTMTFSTTCGTASFSSTSGSTTTTTSVELENCQ